LKAGENLCHEFYELARSIASSEWAWLLGMSVLIMALTTVPYAAGYARQNQDLVFGGAVLNRPDYNVYLSGIQAGLRGLAYYPMLHSPEQGAPVYLRLFYV
jgi:hypothetical protein